MEEAVPQAKDEYVHMMQAPSSLEPIQGAVDTSVALVTNVKSLANTWGPLLQKVKLFSELVDGFAKVSGRVDELCGLWFRSEQTSRFTHTLIWHGASSLLFIRRVLPMLHGYFNLNLS